MSPIEIALLALSAFATAALTGVAGAGGGMLLLAIMLQLMPPAAAIPLHGAVQLAANTVRSWLLRRAIDWRIAWRFSLLLPAGIGIGLLLFQGLPTAVVQMLIGSFVLLSLSLHRIRLLRGRELPLWVFLPLGFATGVLNMIVGVIGPVLAALVIRRPLSKEAVVGTLGLFALASNLLKVGGFALAGFSFRNYGPAIVCMVPAAMLGSRTGRLLLGRIDERRFPLVFRLVLAALAAKLILLDGLVRLWR